ncbi:MAG: hypothetical protein KGJ35_01915, partial [Patescibacteria group bacterium]|nr:hypothetical protein [Patescibacteria group bacterium]
MAYTTEQIQKAFDKLPVDIKQALSSIDTTGVVVDIGEKYDLMYDQISELADEVGLVMLGLSPSAMFTANIGRRMKTDFRKSTAIAGDINKQIFDKMRDSLRKMEAEAEEKLDKGEALDNANETPDDDTVRVTKQSVAEAIEKAGGFIIDKPVEHAPYISSVDLTGVKETPTMTKPKPDAAVEPSDMAIAMTETEQRATAPKKIATPTPKTSKPSVDSAMPLDHLLGDTPEPAKEKSSTIEPTKPPRQTQPVEPAGNPTIKPKTPSISIVDLLLSKGVAMPIGDSDKTDTNTSPKPETKSKPYDGSDPYREPLT